jgi:hypothetical protein
MTFTNSRQRIIDLVAGELEKQELLASQVSLVSWDVAYDNFQVQTPVGIQMIAGYGIIFSGRALADLSGAVALGSNDFVGQAQVLPGSHPTEAVIIAGVREGLEALKKARVDTFQRMQMIQAQAQAQGNGQGQLPPGLIG